jgi:hypothetical protein
MSVSLYSEGKFYQIAASLINWNYYGLKLRRSAEGAGQLAWVFGHDGDDINSRIMNFVNDLYRANQMTFYRQYPRYKRPIVSIDWSLVRDIAPYPHPVALYKSLRGLSYNLVDNEGQTTNFNKSIEILDKLIDSLGVGIIENMPEWNKYDTW